MGYTGGEMADLFAMEPVEDCMEEITDRVGERLHDETVRNTPWDTRNLKTSWYREPVREVRRGGGRAFRTVVATDVDYAPGVEHGTGLWGPAGAKYDIPSSGRMPPGRFMRWRDPATGDWIYAKAVKHPGSRGRHMLGRAMNTIEHEVDSIAAPVTRAWVRRQEALV